MVRRNCTCSDREAHMSFSRNFLSQVRLALDEGAFQTFLVLLFSWKLGGVTTSYLVVNLKDIIRDHPNLLQELDLFLPSTGFKNRRRNPQ
ncbi:hypothetical protein MPTK2_6g90320P [Marchantia polymorpha subsp. ruderalis]